MTTETTTKKPRVYEKSVDDHFRQTIDKAVVKPCLAKLFSDHPPADFKDAVAIFEETHGKVSPSSLKAAMDRCGFKFEKTTALVGLEPTP